MNYLIGTIKHLEANSVKIWAKSAKKFCKAEIILLVLDEELKNEYSELESLGIKINHIKTEHSTNTNITKYNRHLVIRDFLKKLEKDDVVLLTDTTDVVFQADPFSWFEKNCHNDLLISSEGINHINEHWNLGGISNAFPKFTSEILHNEVCNGGVIMGKVEYITDINMFVYALASNVQEKYNEGIDQPALNIILLSNIFNKHIRYTTPSENFAVHCAVAGPTPQFIGWGFDKNYKYDIPRLVNDEIITSQNLPYCIVHQYNRVMEWDLHFKEIYL